MKSFLPQEGQRGVLSCVGDWTGRMREMGVRMKVYENAGGGRSSEGSSVSLLSVSGRATGYQYSTTHLQGIC